jgi:glutaredoxin
MYIVYSKDDCPWCSKAKALLETCGLEYKELKLNEDYSREDLKALLPENTVLTVPQVFAYNKRIGGYKDLETYVEDNGIMGTRQ